MCHPENANVLEDLRDMVRGACVLQAREYDVLACGFFGPNFVWDLATFFDVLQGGSTALVAGAVTYEQLARWIPTPLSANLPLLIDGPAQLSIRNVLYPNNPWGEINHWLALEMFWRVLGAARLPLQPTPATLARACFEGVLAPGALPPAACATRKGPVLQAYDWWWDAAANALQTWWTSDGALLFASGALRLPGLTRVLAQALCPRTLAVRRGLLAGKGNQLVVCVGQLNNSLPYPFAHGAVPDLIARLSDEGDGQRDFTLTAQDWRNLVALWEWLIGADLRDDVAALCPDRKLLTLPALAQNAYESPLPRLYANRLLDELTAVRRVVRSRGLPPGWGARPPVQDLFSHPLTPAPFNFRTWTATMRRYPW